MPRLDLGRVLTALRRVLTALGLVLLASLDYGDLGAVVFWQRLDSRQGPRLVSQMYRTKNGGPSRTL